MDCGNLVYSTDDEVVPPGLVKISACTLEGVDFNTSEDIWTMAAFLSSNVPAGAFSNLKIAFLSSNVPAGAFLNLKIAFLSSNVPAGAFLNLKNYISEQ